MDFFHSQAQHKHPPKNGSRRRLTQDQVRLLERTFIANKKLEPELKLALANQLGVPPRQVAIWYQNKRARWKTQSLELDYNTVQVKLENALAEKKRLEKEVMQLRDELSKAREMMFACNQGIIPSHPSHHFHPLLPPQPPLNVSCNSSCDDGGGGSSLHEDVNGEVLQFDELYACLISPGCGGSTWA